MNRFQFESVDLYGAEYRLLESPFERGIECLISRSHKNTYAFFCILNKSSETGGLGDDLYVDMTTFLYLFLL